MRPDYEAGEIILVDKPYGWTSFDVVNFLKYRLIRITGNKKLKIGHAGTLDPLATGLVIVCTGRRTKKIDEIQATHKTYRGTIYLGATTASYDLETAVRQEVEVRDLSPGALKEAASSFVGVQHQVPPLFSAKKIGGRRAYESARKGEKHEMKPNLVEIFSFELTRIDLPQVEFEIVCSKGTYIRSVAYDLGQKVGCGAFLAALRRTRSGDYTVSEALKISDLKIMLDNPSA